MQKRGQFTMFAIIAIVVIIIVGVTFYFKPSLLEGITESVAYPSEVEEVVEVVQECLEDAAETGVRSVALSGGYYNVQTFSVYVEEMQAYVPYYNYNGEDYTITLEEMETELAEEVKSVVELCVDVTEFSGFEVSEGEVLVETLIGNSSVEVSMVYPIELVKGDTSYSLSEPYEYTVMANLGWLRDVAASITANSIENQDEVDYSFITSQRVGRVAISPYGEDTIIYTLEDSTSFNGEDVLTYMFAEWYPECQEDSDCDTGFACEEYSCVEVEEE